MNDNSILYRNAILLKCLREKKDRDSTTVYFMKTFRASRTCETFFLIVQSLCLNLRGTDNDTERIRKV